MTWCLFFFANNPEMVVARSFVQKYSGQYCQKLSFLCAQLKFIDSVGSHFYWTRKWTHFTTKINSNADRFQANYDHNKITCFTSHAISHHPCKIEKESFIKSSQQENIETSLATLYLKWCRFGLMPFYHQHMYPSITQIMGLGRLSFRREHVGSSGGKYII